MTYLAHSGNSQEYVKPQLYRDHIEHVFNITKNNLNTCFKNSKLDKELLDFLTDVSLISAIYHDLGKLDDNIQPYLNRIDTDYNENIILLNHVDAGVAYLLLKYKETNNLVYLLSSFFVLCHHYGLQNWFSYIKEIKDTLFFSKTVYNPLPNFRCQNNIKEKYNIDINETLEKYTNDNLEKYITIHNDNTDVKYEPITKLKKLTKLTSNQIRIAFSCFIDGDHSDTCNHFSGNKYNYSFPVLDTKKRIEKIDKYVENLPIKTLSQTKLEMRKHIYELCKNSNDEYQYHLLDATVGNGKTLSGLRLALNIADKYNQERIYSIAPFTNIINQTVGVCKQSLTLNKSDKLSINEIHSKVEFENPFLRKYNNIWKAPINVTTAVQFIESLVKPNTSSIRKLYLFCNSVIIFDEFHTLIPHEHWNYILNIMKDLSDNFNTQFIFSSGSPVSYWGIFNKDIKVNQIISTDLFNKMIGDDKKRITFIDIKKTLQTEEFNSLVFSSLKDNNFNSALIVVNTIQNAIVLSKSLKSHNSDYQILHLSSFLTPKHRGELLNEIKEKLNNNEKIILVATSIIECGVDISFQIGFRQRSTHQSAIQFSGRINRENNYDNSSVYIFDFDPSLITNKTFTENPTFKIGKKIMETIETEHISPEYSTDMIVKELSQKSVNVEKFNILEKRKDFKIIGEEFNIIDNNTITVIVDKKLVNCIKNGINIPYRKIMNKSIQLWFTRLTDPRFSLYLKKIMESDKNYYEWIGDYDDIYGIGSYL